MIQELLCRILPHRVIVNCNHDPYLYRWFLVRFDCVGIYLHKFVRSDEDRALHDHPWPFVVIPIWRGYVEYSTSRRRVYPFIGTRIRPAIYRHRVELIDGKPAWSIFIRFKRIREWGFWPAEGFTLWNKWWQDKCE